VSKGLHLIQDDLAEPGWIFWDWLLFTRWLKAWTAA
jgi:hypothetical protein